MLHPHSSSQSFPDVTAPKDPGNQGERKEKPQLTQLETVIVCSSTTLRQSKAKPHALLREVA